MFAVSKLPGNNYLKAASIGLISGFAIGLPGVVAELFGLGSWGLIPFLLSGLSLVVGIASLIGMVFHGVRKRALTISLVCFSFVVCSIFMLRISGEARGFAFFRLAERSIPIVEAVKAFETDTGHPPDSLDNLVPQYLDAVPTTGMKAYPNYEFEVFPIETANKLYWYDLGSRQGADFSGLWKYIDGERDHSILIFAVDGEGKVVNVDTDRLPNEFEDTVFDETLWVNGQQRLQMIRSMLATLKPDGKNISLIMESLGPSDGSRVLRNAAWELRVKNSTGILNWDVFFYWPTEQYPEYAYGGFIEKIGKWAYVHE